MGLFLFLYKYIVKTIDVMDILGGIIVAVVFGCFYGLVFFIAKRMLEDFYEKNPDYKDKIDDRPFFPPYDPYSGLY